MSVYTPVRVEELEAWLPRYSIGHCQSLTAIASGIENTNYFLSTDKGEYVLTLFERVPPEDLPFYLNLMAHLAGKGVACPAPAADRSGAYFSMLNGKPACVVSKLAGSPQLQPKSPHVAAIGAELARLHLASQSYRPRLSNKRGPGWMLATARAVQQFLDQEQNQLIQSELKYQREKRDSYGDKLPRGAIHADLFRDNALFIDEHLQGIFDFGFAATDTYVYDLAITANDWCIDLSTGQFERERLSVFLSAYQQVRPLNENEQQAWVPYTRLGALRFWLSRLYDFHLPRPGEVVHAHDPAHFERVLRLRVSEPLSWSEALTASGANTA
ncbi:MAG: hypothetical protein RLZZ502_1854 [Pseudomonadota bacterium]